MQIVSFIPLAVFAAGAIAAPQPPYPSQPAQTASPIPNYPRGNGWCLTDAQSTFIADQFKFILTATDRNASAALGQVLVAPDYVENSDSINMFTGQPLGGPTFANRSDFIARAAGAATALSVIDTLDNYHTCNKITWEYNIEPFGTHKAPVKGFQKIVVPNPATGVVSTSDTEYNSFAFALNVGFTFIPPPKSS